MKHIKEWKSENACETFQQLYDRYNTVVIRHISYLTGDIHTSEDLAQEVFLKLYNTPPNHPNTAAWLFKVANNLSYNYLRGRNTRKSKEKIIAEDEEDKVISIEEAAIRNSEIRKIRRILNMLPERDRICLLLKFSGYRYGEIAEIIGVKESSVGTVLARTQAKFMQMFVKEG